MNLEFNLLVVSLFRLFYSLNCDGLLETLWEYEKQPDSKEQFLFYKKELFFNLEGKKQEEERRFLVMNASLFAYRKIIPEILSAENKEELYQKTISKIRQYKVTWKNSVETHLLNKNPKKYILKEYENGQNDFKKHYKEAVFAKERMNVIEKWVLDDTLFLSDFYYLDDLLVNQINIIIKTEPTYLILSALLNKEMPDLEKLLIQEENEQELEQEHKGGQVPNIILSDGIFRLEPIKIDNDNPYIEEDETGENFVLSYHLNPNLSILVPKLKVSHELKSIFDSNKDMIRHGKYEMETLTAILEIGREQLKKENKIRFTFAEICKIFGIVPSTSAYERISLAIFYLHLNSYSIKLNDEVSRYFHIISAIEKPTFNSNREKIWTVELDSFLREQIMQYQYTELFARDLTSFSYELTPIIFKILLFDKAEKPDLSKKEYHFEELSTRSFLSGKPSIRKKRILNSLEEILNMEKSPIKKYQIAEQEERYTFFYNETYFNNNQTLDTFFSS